jgi:dolichol-phosphate mannosyltransferase
MPRDGWSVGDKDGSGAREDLTSSGGSAQPGRDSLVIIPTYNELGNLGRLVPSILEQGPFDVLVIDDHSPDGTGELAEVLARRFSGRVWVMHRPDKLGLGTAYLRGFGYALAHGYARVFEMDADFSHDPVCLPELRSDLDHADVVLGSRYVSGGGTRHWPLWRRLISQGGSLYAALVLGLPFRDLTGGFKGFSRRALGSLDLESIHSSGYAFQIEVTHRLHRSGFRIVERPIVFADRRVGQSKMHWRIVAEALLMVWRLRFTPAPPPLPRQTQP